MKALGMIEVYGKLTAVVALDSALKAANVGLASVTQVGGGLVTITFSGDVGAIKAAVDAACTQAKTVGTLISAHVIPRPAQAVKTMLETDFSPTNNEEKDLSFEVEETQIPVVLPEIEKEIKPIEVANGTNAVEVKEGFVDEAKNSGQKVILANKENNNNISAESLNEMTVANLRSLARDLKITTMLRKEIKFANKKALTCAILKFLNKE